MATKDKQTAISTYQFSTTLNVNNPTSTCNFTTNDIGTNKLTLAETSNNFQETEVFPLKGARTEGSFSQAKATHGNGEPSYKGNSKGETGDDYENGNRFQEEPPYQNQSFQATPVSSKL